MDVGILGVVVVVVVVRRALGLHVVTRGDGGVRMGVGRGDGGVRMGVGRGDGRRRGGGFL